VDTRNIVDTKAVRNALLRYRVMAYVVGVLLVVLICIGMPLKYLSDNQYLMAIGSRINTVLGIAHGWLYMLLIVTAIDLGRRVAWTWKRLLVIALAGTVPFLSFVAERSATRDVREKLAATV
jgi:integral membrane protein